MKSIFLIIIICAIISLFLNQNSNIEQGSKKLNSHIAEIAQCE